MKKLYIYIILSLLVLFSISSYFNYSYDKNRFSGFPLDDTWIFFGYAKTFVHTGIFSINQNTPPSAGITSPLYLFIISLFFLLGLKSEFLFILILNSILLIFTSVILFKILFKISENNLLSLFLTIVFILDIRTISIANSGMETLLFVLFEVLSLYLILIKKSPLFFLIIGIGIWVRPEIIFLLIVFLFFNYKNIKIKSLSLFLIPFSFYFIFLKFFTGSFVPQTGKAKSIFFSYINRLAFLKESILFFFRFGFPLIFIFFIISLFLKNKNNFIFLLISYFISFYVFYLFYLPVLYNFGRYLYPLFPLIIIIASFSINKLQLKYKSLIFTILILILIFSIINFRKGKFGYAYSVHQFMVRHIVIANWINNNTSPQAIIATHDIGAIGYLTNRRIVDLVGLTNKDVIGISNKPDKLKIFLEKHNIEYIVVLNSWFKVLKSPLLFQSPQHSKPKFQIFKRTSRTKILRADLCF